MSRIHDALKRVESSRDLLDADSVDTRAQDARRLMDVSSSSVEDDIPAATDLPPRSIAKRSPSVLSDCPAQAWKLDSRRLLSFEGSHFEKTVEEFRGLRARLYQLREKQSLRSLLVTSALRGEGKSFVASNLARVLALQAGCRVLLIDADLRGRHLHGCFGTSVSPGLSEFLLDEVEELETLQRGKADNLFLIPSGRAVAGPTEVISNGRFRVLLSRMTALFDWIIVDSPSAVPVSDACSLSNCCDGVLMVVRSKSTPIDIVRKGLEKFPEEALVGVVLNEMIGVPSSKSGRV